MNSDDMVVTGILAAKCPEDIFGSLTGTPEQMVREARTIYRHQSKIVHPDKAGDNPEAAEAFKKLSSYFEMAQTKIDNGIYGDRKLIEDTGSVVIKTRKTEYLVGEQIALGDICNLYAATTERGKPVILKVARSPADADLVQNEARVLKHLHSTADMSDYLPFIPELVDSFSYQEAGSGVRRQANVLKFHKEEGFYSIEEIREAYPDGVDPKDMAWMCRRLWMTLSFTHFMGVVHGAVLPTHVLIHPEGYGLVMADFSYAVINPDSSGEKIKAISPAYKDWYPEGVFKKETPNYSLDVYMGAKTMVYLLGGDPLTGEIPGMVTVSFEARFKLRSFFRGIIATGPNNQPPTGKLLQEFTNLLRELWGPPVFRPFSMPERKI